MNYWKQFFSSLLRPDDFKLPLMLMSLFFLFLGIRAFWVYFQDERVTEVTARVTRSQTEHSSNLYHPRTNYHFAYEYTFRGKTYTSDRYHYKSEDGHSEAVDRFRVGDEIQVFIDPAQPENAIVDKGWSWLNLVWIVLSVLILARILSLHARQIKEELHQS
ncbi:DUF3592 domain-containing protein [Flavilitoribacter nigricans]|uniref:DUF3592 domain-containing protein n=1 Tax=Flavilitoribacter nigricans (strain ATCC 23147 / DSM 23189 / NBRC 102662 / NCIMB 1420 / SS-2) TaxID=1122177 RepID=A0A2D0NJ21_FLAN2|nr:DUF3592 domain-containing protein [Flavilitoribacter nigricans]PHN08447.1 hypothetical protein CRP01_00610 [Flavilitoribacter nigricans DSM 23189 = NBRC 102662]